MTTNSDIRRHSVSFRYAFQGIKYSFLSQPNFRVHFLITIAVIVLGFILHLSKEEWAVLVLTIFTVLTAEMVNTSIETTVDLVTEELKPLAKIAKDASAGAVLIISVGSMVIGFIIFWPHLFP